MICNELIYGESENPVTIFCNFSPGNSPGAAAPGNVFVASSMQRRLVQPIGLVVHLMISSFLKAIFEAVDR